MRAFTALPCLPDPVRPAWVSYAYWASVSWVPGVLTALHARTCSAAHLLDAAKQRLGGRAVQGVPRGHKAVNFYQAGIEAHQPEPGRYDVIWLQVTSH